MRFELDLEPLDLDLTLGCGQTFRWRRRHDGSWSGPLGAQLVTLRHAGVALAVEVEPGARGYDKVVWDYLRGDDDLPAILEELASRDKILARGLGETVGLRLVKMTPWECLISYVLATNANIPRIVKMIDSLSREFGKKIKDDVYTFPTRSSLTSATAGAFASCGLGYRKRFLHSLVERLQEGTLEGMSRLSTENLTKELLELPGVGHKVSDCVALFGFGRLDAFPIDVWVKRALQRLYGMEGSYRQMRGDAGLRFGRYAGYAQEFLYHNERARAKGGPCAFSEHGT